MSLIRLMMAFFKRQPTQSRNKAIRFYTLKHTPSLSASQFLRSTSRYNTTTARNRTPFLQAEDRQSAILIILYTHLRERRRLDGRQSF
jgi:hypothetical protein